MACSSFIRPPFFLSTSLSFWFCVYLFMRLLLLFATTFWDCLSLSLDGELMFPYLFGKFAMITHREIHFVHSVDCYLYILCYFVFAFDAIHCLL